jgi:(1->4)-alpha-D-glucan 1-alpha-D-glucosylmutase
LRQALREVIAAFPVYRSYTTRAQVGTQDRALINRAIRLAMRRDLATSQSAFRFLRDVLINKVRTPESRPDDAQMVSDLTCKFQQVTAPVTAKGLEDTAFYVYNRLVSLNEVGGEPDRFGVSPQLLHDWNRSRAERFPHALTALSTHDTKRSEDVRARINVLSEVPAAWFQAVKRWSALNARFRGRVGKKAAPDRNAEYLFYQTLLGAWPLEPLDDKAFAGFRDRIRAYMSKAAHEAKCHTSWLTPNPVYDQALDTYVSGVLDRVGNREFFEDFLAFQPLVSHHGQVNSLAQTLLKIASPGSPDTYQGTEVWDFSLVDPDNRRSVDYKHRRALLNELKARHATPGAKIEELTNDLLTHSRDGRIKLYATWRALSCRRVHTDLFGTGDYQPLPSQGPHGESLFAFQRCLGSRIAVVAVPRLSTRLVSTGQFPVGPAVWGETTLELPGVPLGTRLENWFTGKTFETTARGQNQDSILPAGEVFADFPIALLLKSE